MSFIDAYFSFRTAKCGYFLSNACYLLIVREVNNRQPKKESHVVWLIFILWHYLGNHAYLFSGFLSKTDIYLSVFYGVYCKQM